MRACGRRRAPAAPPGTAVPGRDSRDRQPARPRIAAHIDRTAPAHRLAASPPTARRQAASNAARRRADPVHRCRPPGGTPRSPDHAGRFSCEFRRAGTRPMENSAPARQPVRADRRRRPDRPSTADHAQIRNGGRRPGRRRTETGGRAWALREFSRSMRGPSPRATAENATEAAYISVMRPQDILTPVAAGLCCKPGGFHIDPVQPVERALITHGHSDHARPGHGAVLATQETLDMMRLRYGEHFARSTQTIGYGEQIRLGDVSVTFHPAGHVLGSAQIAVSCKNIRIVASGDYKDSPDPTCVPFEVVPCDVFITEATFGLPVFRHGRAAEEVKKLLASVALFPERAHLVGAYSLGKAQRVIALLRAAGY